MEAYKYQQQHEQRQEGTLIQKSIKRVRSTVTLGEKLIFGLLAFATFAVLGLVIYNYSMIYTVNKEVYQLELSIQKQTQTNEGLALQRTELSAPDRILTIATEELGMSLDDNKVKVVQN